MNFHLPTSNLPATQPSPHNYSVFPYIQKSVSLRLTLPVRKKPFVKYLELKQLQLTLAILLDMVLVSRERHEV